MINDKKYSTGVALDPGAIRPMFSSKVYLPFFLPFWELSDLPIGFLYFLPFILDTKIHVHYISVYRFLFEWLSYSAGLISIYFDSCDQRNPFAQDVMSSIGSVLALLESCVHVIQPYFVQVFAKWIMSSE